MTVSPAARVTLIGLALVLVVGVWAGRFTVRTDPVPPSLEAIVALSASLRPSGALMPAGEQRLASAIALVQGGAAPLLITTRELRGPLSTDSAQIESIRRAGLVRRWMLVGHVRSTRDEAVLVARAFPPPRAIGVVTSRSHSRRACAVFERVGFMVTCLPTETANTWRDGVYERLATALYRARGWM